MYQGVGLLCYVSFRPHYGPGVDSAIGTRNLPGGKAIYESNVY
jgi:hypothetical protein